LFVDSDEALVFVLVTKKVDFEETVISAVNKVFKTSVITGCNFHFRQCLWRQIKILLAVIFILDSACGDKSKYYWL